MDHLQPKTSFSDFMEALFKTFESNRELSKWQSGKSKERRKEDGIYNS